MKKICVFGASITSGGNDFKQGGWCDQLKRELLKENIFLLNSSIPGDDTSNLLKRMKSECEARHPDSIIIALGGNDSQYFFEENCFRIPLKETKKNLQKIIDISKEFTLEITLIGLTKVDENKINTQFMKTKTKIYKNESLENYDLAIKDVAEKNNLLFIPTFDVIEKDDLDDGLHPNTKGHQKVLKRVKEHFKVIF